MLQSIEHMNAQWSSVDLKAQVTDMQNSQRQADGFVDNFLQKSLPLLEYIAASLYVWDEA